jgi:hypothetical protein
MGETHRMPKDQQQELELATLAAAALSGLLAGNPVSDSKPLDPSNAAAKELADRAWAWAVLMYRARPAVSRVLV